MNAAVKSAVVTALVFGSLTTPLFAYQWWVDSLGQLIYACSPEVRSDTKLDPPYHNVASKICIQCINYKEGQQYAIRFFFDDSNITNRKAQLHLGGGRVIPIVFDGAYGLDKNRPIDKGEQLFVISKEQTEKIKPQISSASSLMLEVEWDASWYSRLLGEPSAWFNYGNNGYVSAVSEMQRWCYAQPQLCQVNPMKDSTTPICILVEGKDDSDRNPASCYRNGEPHGLWEMRFADGMVQTGTFVDGKKHGSWEERDESGFVSIGIYVDDKRHGQWEERLPDRTVWTGSYVDDKPHGQWEVRFANGDVNTGPFVEGEQHGQWEMRLADGKVANHTYHHGELRKITFLP